MSFKTIPCWYTKEQQINEEDHRKGKNVCPSTKEFFAKHRDIDDPYHFTSFCKFPGIVVSCKCTS